MAGPETIERPDRVLVTLVGARMILGEVDRRRSGLELAVCVRQAPPCELIELPAVIAMFGLKTDCGRLPPQRLPVIAPALQVPVNGALLKRRLWGLN